MTLDIGGTDRAARPPATSRIGAILALAVLALYVLFGVVVGLHTHARLGPSGAPLFYDFSAFYEAGRFADAGHAAAAYDDKAMIAAERAAFPGITVRLPWNYPPSFQMLFMPLAALPYVAAWLIWSSVLYGLYALLARRLLPTRDLWVALLLPAAAINLLVGQNGFLSTVLMGAGVLALERRPIVGGVLLGLLSYKPHFAVLAPVLLVFTRQWRALGGAVVSGAALLLLSLAILGPDAWLAFADKALHPAVFTSSSSDWRNIPSVQILARTLGLPPVAASVLHWAVALAATVGAAWVWRRSDDARLRAGALAAATLLVTPYLRLYDLTLLILPIAALMAPADGEPGLGERAILVVAWLAPAVLLFTPPGVQLGPLVTLALMALVLWRMRRTAGSTMRLTLHAS
ncbi:MAG: glycosyltransferase family 87 protein [Caulobacteraceae bacterium]|nr:glycosyltransferase family 87 protein [Caulobacteraceae bacterium]